MLRMLGNIKTAVSPVMGFAIFLFLLSSPSLAGECLKYEPSVTVLKGTLRVRTIPGPPEYANIKAGDRPEIITILKLEKPICVSADPTSDTNTEAEEDVDEIQIGPLGHLIPGWPKQFAQVKSKKALVAGTLFHRHTGHHRTAILMDVKKNRIPRKMNHPNGRKE